ncbi:hypothetical protein CTheo_4683 [Ceratobasidium theobromae]|uniref:Uncharacterized protein n=1 Tax=Ceratobasidium theobromae TaxID=1582974 RepID=A0A5N5QJG7_9AGAM|nr:hypothetical protein CTheo_4683 [Ceratobasidium theobromae]
MSNNATVAPQTESRSGILFKDIASVWVNLTQVDATEREYQSDDRSEGLVSAERCLVTLETEPVRYCQLFLRLRAAWGIEPPQMLDLGSPYNKIPLRSDLRETFDSGNWALAPSKDVLEMIAAKTFTLGCSPKPWPEYTDLIPNEQYSYHFIHFRGAPGAIVRLSARGIVVPRTYTTPFTDMPPIQSDLHPYFAICDIALKAARTYRALNSGRVVKLSPELQVCVNMCIAIYTQWMSLGGPVDCPSLLYLTRRAANIQVNAPKEETSQSPDPKPRAPRKSGNKRGYTVEDSSSDEGRSDIRARLRPRQSLNATQGRK